MMNAAHDGGRLMATLRLIRSKGIGPVSYYKLINTYGTPMQALAALLESKREGICTQVQAEQEIEAHKKIGATLIDYTADTYPSLLKELNDAPPLLSVQGHVGLLKRPLFSIVGARNASISSRQFTYGLSKGLSERGWTVVSGFALGIDMAAHEGALEAGSVAVFAGGIDKIYPPEHMKKYEAFLETGVAISEVPLGTVPAKPYFPRRNRIIAGVSKGTLVVEAAFQSGSLITAGMAGDLGREVFACPGSPMDPRCRGSNRLLKDGAHFVENMYDILENLEGAPAALPDQERLEGMSEMTGGTPLEERILTALSATPINIDLLIEDVGIAPQKLFELVGSLELKGKIVRLPGNCVALRLSQ